MNVQSLTNKVEELSIFLNNFSYDVACISEHWCNLNTLNCISLDNYNLITSFCREEHVHGGVCIYARTDIQCKIVDVRPYCKELDAEFCAVEIPSKILIIALYRSTSGDGDLFLRLFDQLLNDLFGKYVSICILGDFNINFKGNSYLLKELSCIMDSYGIFATISESTRVFNGSDSCIDNILTNRTDFASGVVDPCLSDHFAQYINIKLTAKSSQPNRKIRFINSGGVNKLNNDLYRLNLNSFYQSNCVNYLANLLVSECQMLINKYFPLRNVTGNGAPIAWFNDELKIKRETLSTVKLMSNESSNPLYGELYKILHKDYKKSILGAKREAYENFIINSSNKAKDVWKIINLERNKSSFRRVDNNLSADDFNKFYVSVATNIVSQLSISPDFQKTLLNNIPVSSHSFVLLPIVEQDVVNAIKYLKNSNSYDVYNLSSNILKKIYTPLVRPLTHLFNMCIDQGKFPDCFKISRVVPIFKKGDADSVENYRPISIVPLFGKIFEIILKNNLVEYFDRHSVVHSSQFGFRKGYSTVQAVTGIIDGIVEGLERGDCIGLTLCDLSRAFDCVSHELLLAKLERYGVRGPPLCLLDSYLRDRTQCVSIGDDVSDLCGVESGVPQGSVLGPLLFILYINDLFFYLYPDRAVCYADDTTLICNANTRMELECKMNLLRTRAQTWFTHNNLKLNVEKNQEIIFSTRPGFAQGVSARIVGMVLDDTLGWGAHIAALKSRLSPVLFVLRRLQKLISKPSLLTVYYSLFHCHISYGVHLWGNSPGALSVFRLQKRVVRIVVDAKYSDHCKPHFINLQILTLPSLYILCQLLEIHKNRGKYKLNSSYHSYSTRSGNLIRPPKFRLEKSYNNSLNINLYNCLPNTVKNLALNKFKIIIKKYLRDRAFYTIDEYMHAVSGDCSSLETLIR